ncbi:MAG: cell division protein FtsZ [Polyangia bacterium]
MHFELDDNDQQARIRVVGVGGGGGNAVANMIAEQMEGVDFISVNTDYQALEANPAGTKIQVGSSLTKGLGAGGIPDLGRKAALEDVARVEDTLRGSDMVFVAAGMGGGTGTGAAPIVAQVARDCEALTVGVVTRPFRFEGRKRCRIAEEGILALAEEVDTLIVIPNERLLQLDDTLAINEAFVFADRVLCNAVRGISDLITVRGNINVDFADVRTIMTNRGRALMGTGYGKGDRRAVEAAEMAINSPLLEDVLIDGATGILINITGGTEMTMPEVAEAVSMIEDSADEDAHIIFGYVSLEESCEEVKVTVIATGFQGEATAEQQGGARVSRPSATAPRSFYGNRSSVNRPSSRQLQQSQSPSHAPGRPSEVPEQVQIPAGRSAGARASATSEHDLDIPAFIRRQSEG